MRKKRRGEPLTHEEREALSGWQGLSIGRKALAVGAFSIGTFGLGFTLGGLDLRPLAQGLTLPGRGLPPTRQEASAGVRLEQ